MAQGSNDTLQFKPVSFGSPKGVMRMVHFDQNMTEIIFFDTEFYVPEEDRERVGASLIANPYRENHMLLGGVFHRYFPLRPKESSNEYSHFWVWRDGDERTVLRLMYELFRNSWSRIADKDPMQADLMVSGIGVSRFDLPIIFCRSLEYDFASPEELFECYFTLKQVDLSNVGLGFFNKGHRVFYPKTTNSLLGRFGLRKEKSSGASVWDMYDTESFDEIEERTEEEVKDCVELYERMIRSTFG